MRCEPTAGKAAGAVVAPTIPFVAAPAVRAAIGRFGRTEDIRFSPDNRRLAIARYHHHAVALLDVEIAVRDGRPHVTVTHVAELGSPRLDNPHGVEFLDDETIIVANRAGGVVLFRLPPRGRSGWAELTPIDPPPGVGFEQAESAGSVRAGRRADGGVEVLVCDNAIHVVMRYVLHDDGESIVVLSSERLLRRLLEIPDGVAVSDDGRWIAVSNHEGHCVMLYERSRLLDETSAPCGVLRGAVYPHGLRFSADARHLVVADASRPYLHVYTREGEGWRRVQYPTASVRVMDDDAYQQGRYNPEEGGPKGLDIDRSGRVLAVTTEHQPLAFFDASDLLGGNESPEHAMRLDYEQAVLEKQVQRIGWLRAVEDRSAALHAVRFAEARAVVVDRRADKAEVRARTAEARAEMAEARARTAEVNERAAEARADTAEAHLAAFERTKTIRLTRPLRRAYRIWLKARSGPR